MNRSSMFPLLFALVASSAVYGSISGIRDEDDEHCNGHCVIDLGNFNCSVALQKYEFSGNCCSLQNAPTGTGYCQLLVTSGFCDFATKGYGKCMDDLEDSSKSPFDAAICGTIRTVIGTSDTGCPVSNFAIPDPFLEENDEDATSVISIDVELKFKFDQGKGRPPSDMEINVVLEEAEAFLTDYLQEKERDSTNGLYNFILLSWFELEDIRKHYDYAAAEAAISFSLAFHVANSTDGNDEKLENAKEILQTIVRRADVPGHFRQQIPEMTAIDHSYNVFHATQSVAYRATLVA